MLKRLAKLLYYIVLAIALIPMIALPTIQHGVIGWFIGTGCVINTLLLMALLEASINWIVNGEFKVLQEKQCDE